MCVLYDLGEKKGVSLRIVLLRLLTFSKGQPATKPNII